MEFHRSTSASRQSRLSSHLNATDVSRGAITSDGRLLTRTGLYRAAAAAPSPVPSNPSGHPVSRRTARGRERERKRGIDREKERTSRMREREREGTNQPLRELSSAHRASGQPSVYVSALRWAAGVKTWTWVANRRDTSSTVRWKLLLRKGARRPISGNTNDRITVPVLVFVLRSWVKSPPIVISRSWETKTLIFAFFRSIQKRIICRLITE